MRNRYVSSTLDELWDPTALARRRDDKRHWLRWIATRLPDPEEQKALKRALDEAYPPSKWRTIAGAIVVGAGSRMVLTALGAIVEWFVQGWLGQIPWLK